MRKKWIDNIRGLAFLMVIFNHLDYCNTVIMRYFSPIFLTSFFFVSGYLFKERLSFSSMFEHRVRTLLLPFVILGSFMIVLSEIFSLNTTHIGLVDSFIELFTQYGRAHINTMWFIPSLFFYSIAFYILLRIFDEKNYLLVAIASFILNWAYVYPYNGMSLPFNLQWTGFACFYMFLGRFYKMSEWKFDKIFSPVLFIIGMLLYISLITVLDTSGNYFINFYASPFLLDAILLTIIGIYVMIFIGKKLNSRFISFIGANSLLYFALHGKILSLVNYASIHIWGDSAIAKSLPVHEIILLSKTIIGALLLVPICYIISSFFPQVLGRGFKLWKYK